MNSHGLGVYRSVYIYLCCKDVPHRADQSILFGQWDILFGQLERLNNMKIVLKLLEILFGAQIRAKLS